MWVLSLRDHALGVIDDRDEIHRRNRVGRVSDKTARVTWSGLPICIKAEPEPLIQKKINKARALHKSRGQLLPRERIAALIDPGSPFLDFGHLAGEGMYDGVPPGATIITGVGQICGRSCMLIANDATVKGGTLFGMTTKKHTRAQLFAWQHRLPCITVWCSRAAALLPDLANIFPDEGQAGSIMYNQVKMSAENISQIAIVHGPSTAGGAYIPALCDEVVIVRNQGAMFLGSPQLVFAATGEVIDIEPLGGAEMHSRVSGVTDHIAENDSHALAIARDIVARLGEPPQLRWTPKPSQPPACAVGGNLRDCQRQQAHADRQSRNSGAADRR